MGWRVLFTASPSCLMAGHFVWYVLVDYMMGAFVSLVEKIRGNLLPERVTGVTRIF